MFQSLGHIVRLLAQVAWSFRNSLLFFTIGSVRILAGSWVWDFVTQN